jgi:IS605 OrfB family transposase
MRFRLHPTAAQEAGLRGHCAQARFVWNLALEQANWYRPECGPTPGYVAQSAQLTEARAASAWLASGSFTIQQQALRDFAQAMKNWWAGTHRRPTWRKKGRHEGFRIVAVRAGHLRRLNRRFAEVFVPKIGWVRFRLTRPLPTGAKSYRVTLDTAGRWHIAFALRPEPIDRRPSGAMIGVDRGVANTLATSDGQLLHAPVLTPMERARLARLQRRLARRKKGSRRRERAKRALARLRARDADRAKDWIEKSTTSLVRDYDLVAIEDLRVKAITRSARGTIDAPGRNVGAKSGLNREILAQRWGLFARRLSDKAALAGVAVVKVNPVNTSRRCHACGHVAAENRKNQAVFSCVICGHLAHADVNAAMNILAAGRAVTAQGEAVVVASMNCEPQHAPPTAA